MEPGKPDGAKTPGAGRRSLGTKVEKLPIEKRAPAKGTIDIPLVRATHTDEEGRKWVVLMPEGGNPAMGIPVGPPDVSVLPWLTPTQAMRLHDQLYNRGLITKRDIRGRAHEVQASIQAALKLDVAAVTGLYE